MLPTPIAKRKRLNRERSTIPERGIRDTDDPATRQTCLGLSTHDNGGTQLDRTRYAPYLVILVNGLAYSLETFRACNLYVTVKNIH